LFFAWGFITSLIDPLVAAVKGIFTLTDLPGAGGGLRLLHRLWPRFVSGGGAAGAIEVDSDDPDRAGA
jgi:hypothetical protein